MDKYENLENYLKTPSSRGQFHRHINEYCTDAFLELQKIAKQLPSKYRRKIFVKSELLKLMHVILTVESQDAKKTEIIKNKKLFDFAVRLAATALQSADVLVDAEARMAFRGGGRTPFPSASDLKLLTTLFYYPQWFKPMEKKRGETVK